MHSLQIAIRISAGSDEKHTDAVVILAVFAVPGSSAMGPGSAATNSIRSLFIVEGCSASRLINQISIESIIGLQVVYNTSSRESGGCRDDCTFSWWSKKVVSCSCIFLGCSVVTLSTICVSWWLQNHATVRSHVNGGGHMCINTSTLQAFCKKELVPILVVSSNRTELKAEF